MARIDVLGVGFDNVTMDEAAGQALSLASGVNGKHYIVTPNSEIVYDSLKNPELRRILNSAAMVIPDGAGVVLASKILGTPLKQKVAGIDLAKRLLQGMAGRGLRVFLFGAKPGVAERAAKRLCEDVPGLTVCGTYHGFFKDDAEPLAVINAAKPDAVLVCLGAPRQEKWMVKNLSATDTHRMIGLGGSLDGYAGDVKRAPDIMIKLNLEWFYRLLKEPNRIGRMMRLPKFIFKAVSLRLTGGGKRGEG
jgi:N-acetylglucosaminyldiphosphoundecaprenol N-acetyl-beta-D-mannosaminyltransferase